MANNGKTAEIANRFMSGQITSQKQVVAAAQESAEAYAEVTQQFESQALMGNFGPAFGSYQVGLKMTTAAQNDLNANYEQAVKDAAKRDKTTEDMAKAENNAREQQLFLQDQLNKGMDVFVTALGKGQTANQEMIDYIMKDLLPVFKDLFDVYVDLKVSPAPNFTLVDDKCLVKLAYLAECIGDRKMAFQIIGYFLSYRFEYMAKAWKIEMPKLEEDLQMPGHFLTAEQWREKWMSGALHFGNDERNA
jgi:hypothetical protein